MNTESLRLALLAALWCGLAAVSASATTVPAESSLEAAAVFAEAGDSFSSVVRGIGDNPDLVVFHIALKPEERDAAASASRYARQLKLPYAGQGAIAVIYPDIGEPYRNVFLKIIEGIEDRAKTTVASFAIAANQNPADLLAELRRQEIRVVIALGRNGLKAAAGLDRDIGIVVGGVLSVPEGEVQGMAVHSLAPDPYLLFERLRGLMPGVRRVFVIYDPRQNGWLIRLAREAARSQGLELVAQEATDLKSAMYLYQETIAVADARRDALWLPQDSVTVDDSAVLPMVLKEAWNRSLVVFSSSVGHVRRGALFSLYPNNLEVGRNLASSALSHLSGAPARTVTPLRDVLVAVNVRTAGHLGLGLAGRQPGYDLVFPEP